MTRLVYLSPVAWDSFAQRPQKFALWFHEKTCGEVLWVEPYPSRFPCMADFKKIGVNDKTESVRPEGWLKILTPKALPLEPLPFSGIVNRGLYWSNTIEQIKIFSEQEETLLVIGKPTVLALQTLKELKNCKTVYDAMDDFPTFFKGLSKSAMARRELAIGRSVDLVLASSTKLREKWNRHNANVTFVPNGLDFALMPSTINQITNKTPKVFGYLGTIGEWFDWKWVINLAKFCPEDTVHIIGPVFNRPQSKLPANIKISPPCSHEQAMARMLSFDIAIIPFKKNELTASVDPIKYYEYSALGLPIISTRFGEMNYRNNAEGVYLCDDDREMQKAISDALSYRTTLELCQVFRASNNWAARFNAIGLI